LILICEKSDVIWSFPLALYKRC